MCTRQGDKIFARRRLPPTGTKHIQAVPADLFLLTSDLLERKTNG